MDTDVFLRIQKSLQVLQGNLIRGTGENHRRSHLGVGIVASVRSLLSLLVLASFAIITLVSLNQRLVNARNGDISSATMVGKKGQEYGKKIKGYDPERCYPLTIYLKSTTWGYPGESQYYQCI